MHQKIAAPTPTAILLPYFSFLFSLYCQQLSLFSKPIFMPLTPFHNTVEMRLSPHNLTVITEPDLQLRAYKSMLLSPK